MTELDIARLEHASRSAMAYDLGDEPSQISKLMTAAVPAFGILVACAVMLVAVL